MSKRLPKEECLPGVLEGDNALSDEPRLPPTPEEVAELRRRVKHSDGGVDDGMNVEAPRLTPMSEEVAKLRQLAQRNGDRKAPDKFATMKRIDRQLSELGDRDRAGVLAWLKANWMDGKDAE